jgi:hypothetical protein
MATEKQIAANRANALRSTGPTSPEGKAISSRNGLTHGFCASHATIKIETNAEFLSILDELTSDLQPEGKFECSQVYAMAAAEWRHRRAIRYDTGLADVGLAHLRKTRDNLHYPDDPPFDDKVAWNDTDFLERRETRLLGETFDKCGIALLRNANYSTKFRREYDNAYSKLIISQDRRRRLAKLGGPQNAD